MLQDIGNRRPLLPGVGDADEEREGSDSDSDGKEPAEEFVRATSLSEDEGCKSGASGASGESTEPQQHNGGEEGEENEGRASGEGLPEAPRPSAEQTFSDGKGAAEACRTCALAAAAPATTTTTTAAAAARTVEGDKSGIARMCVLNDGARVLTQDSLGAFAVWRVADLARVDAEEGAGAAAGTPFEEYAKRCNEGIPEGRRLVRVDASTGVLQVVVKEEDVMAAANNNNDNDNNNDENEEGEEEREGDGARRAVLRRILAAALREGARVDLFRTQSLGAGTAATTVYYRDPAALFREEEQEEQQQQP